MALAHYDAVRNRGYDGYGKKEPAYSTAVVGYSAVSESYVASTEQVVKLSGYPYSNPATHDGQVWPLSSTHAQFKRDDDYDYDYSPKFSHVTNSPHESPRKTSYRANSPPQGHYSDMNPYNSPRKNFHSQVRPLSSIRDKPKKSDDYDYSPKISHVTNSPRDENFHGQVRPLSFTRIQPKKDDDFDYSPKFSHVTNSSHDSPRKTSYRANSPPQGHYSDMNSYNSPRKNFHSQVRPLSSIRVEPRKSDDYDYSPKFSHVTNSPHDSPRKTFVRATSPPPMHYSGMFDTNHNSSHDSPRNYFRGSRGNFSSLGDDSSNDDDDVECRDGVCYPKSKHVQEYNREKPRKDSYHQTSEPRKYYNTDKLPEANNNFADHKKPETDAYYDDRNRNNPRDATHWRPPGKEHQEVIDGAEKQRWHGTMPPPQSDIMYRKTIDSDTLAKMYGGVYLK